MFEFLPLSNTIVGWILESSFSFDSRITECANISKKDEQTTFSMFKQGKSEKQRELESWESLGVSFPRPDQVSQALHPRLQLSCGGSTDLPGAMLIYSDQLVGTVNAIDFDGITNL